MAENNYCAAENAAMVLQPTAAYELKSNAAELHSSALCDQQNAAELQSTVVDKQQNSLELQSTAVCKTDNVADFHSTVCDQQKAVNVPSLVPCKQRKTAGIRWTAVSKQKNAEKLSLSVLCKQQKPAEIQSSAEFEERNTADLHWLAVDDKQNAAELSSSIGFKLQNAAELSASIGSEPQNAAEFSSSIGSEPQNAAELPSTAVCEHQHAAELYSSAVSEQQNTEIVLTNEQTRLCALWINNHNTEALKIVAVIRLGLETLATLHNFDEQIQIFQLDNKIDSEIFKIFSWFQGSLLERCDIDFVYLKSVVEAIHPETLSAIKYKYDLHDLQYLFNLFLTAYTNVQRNLYMNAVSRIHKNDHIIGKLQTKVNVNGLKLHQLQIELEETTFLDTGKYEAASSETEIDLEAEKHLQNLRNEIFYYKNKIKRRTNLHSYLMKIQGSECNKLNEKILKISNKFKKDKTTFDKVNKELRNGIELIEKLKKKSELKLAKIQKKRKAYKKSITTKNYAEAQKEQHISSTKKQ